MCWRGGGRQGRSKRDLELESPRLHRRNPASEGNDYRKPQYYGPHPYHLQFVDSGKHYNHKLRTVARPTTAKRTSSASTGYTTESKSTHCDSTESPSLPRPRHINKSQSSPHLQRDRQVQPSTEGLKTKLPSRSSSQKKGKAKAKPTRSTRGVSDPKNDMYVSIKHDNETITELSTPDMDLGSEEDESEDLSNEYASRFSGSRSYRTGSDFSDINGFTSYQPDGVLEATILRNDSDSTRDMSVLGAEAHVTVYNLSERMSYDLRETGRNLSTFATKVAHACIANPKLIMHK